ncbi:MAG: hypothetical protein V9F00_06420 [Nocardioides sp.]
MDLVQMVVDVIPHLPFKKLAAISGKVGNLRSLGQDGTACQLGLLAKARTEIPGLSQA